MPEGKKDKEEPKLVENIPEEIGVVQEMMKFSGFSGPMHPSVYEKIDKEHIHKILDQSDKDDERSLLFSREGRWQKYALILILIIVFVVLTLTMVENHTDIYLEILKLLVVFGGGLGAGYGLSRRK